MPRNVSTTIPLDDLDDEVLFTRAALKADDDAKDFLPVTDEWQPRVDALRVQQRTTITAEAEADAVRAVTSSRLDLASTRFSKDLKRAVDDDLDSPRFKTFFRESPTQFNRQPLADQVTAVEAWTGSTDPVVAAHKEPLTKATTAVRGALQQTAAVPLVQGELRTARAEHAARLTKDRDLLHAELVKRAIERGLPSTWADAFFRVESSRPKKDPKQN